MTHGFHVGMVTCAILAALGGILAWLTIISSLLAGTDIVAESPASVRTGRTWRQVAAERATAWRLDETT